MTISSLDFKARWLTFLEENLEYDITMILSGQRRNNVIDLNFLDLDIFDFVLEALCLVIFIWVYPPQH